MSKYVLSVDADLDLDDIWEYIAMDSLDAAERWIAKLFEAFDVLLKKPPRLAEAGQTHNGMTDLPQTA